MSAMTPKQNELYQWLLARIDDPIGPSFSQMAEAVGLRAKSGVVRLIDGLEARGLVTRQPNMANSVRAVRRGSLDGVPSASLIAELMRRGEYQPDGR